MNDDELAIRWQPITFFFLCARTDGRNLAQNVAWTSDDWDVCIIPSLYCKVRNTRVWLWLVDASIGMSLHLTPLGIVCAVRSYLAFSFILPAWMPWMPCSLLSSSALLSAVACPRPRQPCVAASLGRGTAPLVLSVHFLCFFRCNQLSFIELPSAFVALSTIVRHR